MNHCVPEFHEMEDDDSIPTPSSFSRHKKPAAGEEEIMELIWQNGQVVAQSQNQRPSKRSAFGSASAGEVLIPAERDIRLSGQQHLFMQEDEMASWLQYPLDDSSFDRDLYADFLYTAPPPPTMSSTTTQPSAAAEIRLPPAPAPPRPPMPPAVTKPDNPPHLHNFVHFSTHPIRLKNEWTPPVRTERALTVVDSNETPMAGPESRSSHMVKDSRPHMNTVRGTATAGGDSVAAGELAAGTCKLTATSSPGGSRTSFSPSGDTREQQQQQQKPPPPVDERKRKARQADDSECQSEDIGYEGTDAKKQTRGSASTKRSRAAEVHNLSERRRRDRINEKMKALQELIPSCNKSDKASMLDEAIEYLKSLQLQVQMMSMGCVMAPMMYPGVQQYMPAMGMGMNRPMVPYPSMLPGSVMPNPAAAHMAGPRYPMPLFHMPPPVHVPDPSSMQASNQTSLPPNSVAPHNQMPNFVDPYQQFLSFHHSQLPLPQNEAAVHHGAKEPSTSREVGNPDNKQNG